MENFETLELVDGYDRRKTPRKLKFRRWTIEDIRTYNGGTVWFETNQGNAKQCRSNGSMKTWKTDPNRFEQSFKYGMYENFRMTTKDMLDTLLVLIEDEEVTI